MFYSYVNWLCELIVDDMPFSAWVSRRKVRGEREGDKLVPGMCHKKENWLHSDTETIMKCESMYEINKISGYVRCVHSHRALFYIFLLDETFVNVEIETLLFSR